MANKPDFKLEDEETSITNGKKDYLVKITVEIPYPKELEFREQATFCGTAINRALKKARKQLKGRHLNTVLVRAVRYN